MRVENCLGITYHVSDTIELTIHKQDNLISLHFDFGWAHTEINNERIESFHIFHRNIQICHNFQTENLVGVYQWWHDNHLILFILPRCCIILQKMAKGSAFSFPVMYSTFFWLLNFPTSLLYIMWSKAFYLGLLWCFLWKGVLIILLFTKDTFDIVLYKIYSYKKNKSGICIKVH